MSSISRISGSSTQKISDDTAELFKSQLEKAFEKTLAVYKNNDAMKAFETAMQKMQRDQFNGDDKAPQDAQNSNKPKKPQKPKPDENKYRAIAEKMADQKGNSNGKVDTPQEEADVKTIMQQLIAADPDAQQKGDE